jgi:hypothetical protein
MRSTFLFLPGLLCAACSHASSSAGAPEAGLDAAADVTDDSCFPFCASSSSGSGSGGGGGDDGGGDATCPQLKTQIQMLQAPAQACNPTQPSQCNGIAEGICCPITVTAGNDQAVNTFQQTVDAYKSQCDAACITTVCPTAPSLQCQATQGMQGVCQ